MSANSSSLLWCLLSKTIQSGRRKTQIGSEKDNWTSKSAPPQASSGAASINQARSTAGWSCPEKAPHPVTITAGRHGRNLPPATMKHRWRAPCRSSRCRRKLCSVCCLPPFVTCAHALCTWIHGHAQTLNAGTNEIIIMARPVNLWFAVFTVLHELGSALRSRIISFVSRGRTDLKTRAILDIDRR